MQLCVCFPSSGRAFIEWNRQNSEPTQCACVDIAIQFISRCSASVLLNTARCLVATGCGDYWGKRYTHCKAITMYVPCLIFLEHWPNSVCWGKHCPFICVLCLLVNMRVQMNLLPPFSPRYCFLPHLNVLLIQNYAVNAIYTICNSFLALMFLHTWVSLSWLLYLNFVLIYCLM